MLLVIGGVVLVVSTRRRARPATKSLTAEERAALAKVVDGEG